MKNVAVIVVALSFAACSPYSPDLGVAPFRCGDADPKCPDGYECQAQGSGASLCILPGGTAPDAANNCANDSALEPNDTIQTAYITGVADSKLTIPYAGLAICPAGDKDTYSIHITQSMQNLEVVVTYDPNGAALTGALLSSAGSTVLAMSPVTGMQGVIRAYAANLNVATFYAQVTGPASGTLLTNNYKMTITVTGP